MVRHRTISDEGFWFRGIVAGEPTCVSTSEEDAEAAWQVPAALTAAAVLEPYRREIELADAVIAATPLSRPPAIWPVEIWPNWRLQDFRSLAARDHRDGLPRFDEAQRARLQRLPGGRAARVQVISWPVQPAGRRLSSSSTRAWTLTWSSGSASCPAAAGSSGC